MDRIVHLSFGDFPGSEYTLQLFADHLIHAWDLARGVGADEHLDEKLVTSCATWFEAVEEAYRGAGAIAARPPVPGHADPRPCCLPVSADVLDKVRAPFIPCRPSHHSGLPGCLRVRTGRGGSPCPRVRSLVLSSICNAVSRSLVRPARDIRLLRGQRSRRPSTEGTDQR